jgi:hypothetical protein
MNSARPGPLAPWSRLFRWLRGYVFKRGFLDGAHGWRIAAFCAREAFLKYQLLRALNRASQVCSASRFRILQVNSVFNGGGTDNQTLELAAVSARPG